MVKSVSSKMNLYFPICNWIGWVESTTGSINKSVYLEQMNVIYHCECEWWMIYWCRISVSHKDMLNRLWGLKRGTVTEHVPRWIMEMEWLVRMMGTGNRHIEVAQKWNLKGGTGWCGWREASGHAHWVPTLQVSIITGSVPGSLTWACQKCAHQYILRSTWVVTCHTGAVGS